MYTDEGIATLKKEIEAKIHEAFFKLNKIEVDMDEEIDKLRKLKIGREDLPQFEITLRNKIETDLYNVNIFLKM